VQTNNTLDPFDDFVFGIGSQPSTRPPSLVKPFRKDLTGFAAQSQRRIQKMQILQNRISTDFPSHFLYLHLAKLKNGAGDEIRTHDIHLGKVALYH